MKQWIEFNLDDCAAARCALRVLAPLSGFLANSGTVEKVTLLDLALSNCAV